MGAERSGSMSTAARYDIGALLETSGAKPCGARHGCPKCGGVRTVTHTAECFFCHKCGWRGNVVTLAKELGLYERLPRAEFVLQRQGRERAEVQARNFLAECRLERLRACEELRELGRLELLAHEAGPEHPATWNALATAYTRRPGAAARAVLFSEGAIADRRAWLESDAQGRGRILENILLAGGLSDSAGKFLGVR